MVSKKKTQVVQSHHTAVDCVQIRPPYADKQEHIIIILKKRDKRISWNVCGMPCAWNANYSTTISKCVISTWYTSITKGSTHSIPSA